MKKRIKVGRGFPAKLNLPSIEEVVSVVYGKYLLMEKTWYNAGENIKYSFLLKNNKLFGMYYLIDSIKYPILNSKATVNEINVVIQTIYNSVLSTPCWCESIEEVISDAYRISGTGMFSNTMFIKTMSQFMENQNVECS